MAPRHDARSSPPPYSQDIAANRAHQRHSARPASPPAQRLEALHLGRPQRDPNGNSDSAPIDAADSGHSKNIEQDRVPAKSNSNPFSSTRRKRDVYIVVMGVTGAGKSSFISLCSGKPVRIGHSLMSCTADVEEVTFKYDSRTTVHLIDTPGFDDTTRSDTEVLREIAHWLSMSYGSGTLLNGLIYLHRITDHRMQGSATKNLRMFKKLCGEQCFRNVMLATTMWQKVDPAIGEAREQELLSTPEFWGYMAKKGSTVMRHTGDEEAAMAIIDHIVEQGQSVVLDIQEEIIDQRCNLDDTAAAKVVNEDILREREKHKQQLEELQADMEAAMAERDEDLENILREQRDIVQRKLEQGRRDQDALRANLEELHQQKEKEFLEFKAKLEVERRREREAYEQQMEVKMQLMKNAQDDERETLKREMAEMSRRHEANLAQFSADEQKKAQGTFFGTLGSTVKEVYYVVKNGVRQAFTSRK